MKHKSASRAIAALGLCSVLVSCGGENDPFVKAINESLDVEIEEFDISTRDLFPGEKVKIRWRSSGAILFDAIVYLSADKTPSGDDFTVLAEDCSTSASDHCEGNENIVFDCLYKSDNSFDCEEDDDVISENDLTPWLDTLPKTTNVILELCNDDDCEWESKEMTFH